MDAQSRMQAIVAYKERKPVLGVFAVICTATGAVWVGRSRHLDTQKNGLWFTLRHGSSPYRTLQDAWSLHGEAEFRFEELDRLSEDVPGFAEAADLKQRQSLWMQRLRAQAL